MTHKAMSVGALAFVSDVSNILTDKKNLDLLYIISFVFAFQMFSCLESVGSETA